MLSTRIQNDDRRLEPREKLIYRPLLIESEQFTAFCLAKNLSPSGLMAKSYTQCAVDTPIRVHFNDIFSIAGRIAWSKDLEIGISFDQPVDVVELLHVLAQPHHNGLVNRSPRLALTTREHILHQGRKVPVEVINISQTGVKMRATSLSAGDEVTVCIAGLEERRAEVKWAKNGEAGANFLRPLPFDMLGQWAIARQLSRRAAGAAETHVPRRENPIKLHLIDDNVVRRANAVFELDRNSIRIEPYESLSEFAGAAMEGDAVLVHDTGGAVSQTLKYLGEANAWLPVVAYAETPALDQVVDAINSGASDFISWPLSGEKITSLIGRLESDDLTNSRIVFRRKYALSRLRHLSKRERQVLELVAAGHTSKTIGDWLGISPKTAEIHRANCFTKLGVQRSTEAVLIAFEAGLGSPPVVNRRASCLRG